MGSPVIAASLAFVCPGPGLASLAASTACLQPLCFARLTGPPSHLARHPQVALDEPQPQFSSCASNPHAERGSRGKAGASRRDRVALSHSRKEGRRAGLEAPSLSSPLLHNTLSNPEKKDSSLLLLVVVRVETRSSASPRNAKSFILVSCVLCGLVNLMHFLLPLLLLGQDCSPLQALFVDRFLLSKTFPAHPTLFLPDKP